MEELAISHLHGPRGVTEKIKAAMYESAKQFVYIGFLLWEVKEYKYYEEGGYEDVYAYAEYELGFKKTSTKNFIAISETFGCEKHTYYGNLHTTTLQPTYEKFNYSQLVEMLGMSEAQRKKVTPDMTVRQLREIKKESISDESTDLGQTSDQETTNLKAIVINNYWKDIDEDIIKAIVKAAGVRWNPKSCYNIKVELKKEY